MSISTGLPASSSTEAFIELLYLQPELKDMPDFNATHDSQHTDPGRTGVSGDHIAQVRGRGFRQIPTPIHAGEMEILFIRPADKIRQYQRGMVGVDTQALQVRPAPGTRARCRSPPVSARRWPFAAARRHREVSAP
jgi:hypothetical protein